MKKICIVSSGRYDYGYLYWIMKDIQASDKLALTVLLPSNHHNKAEILAEFPAVTVHSVEGIFDYGAFYEDCLNTFKALYPDIVMLLGDRFEIHAAAVAATLLNIPIAHLHGGETTKGAFDDALRNSITQMATWHFTANIDYADNIARILKHNTYFNFVKHEKLYNTGILKYDIYDNMYYTCDCEKFSHEIRIFNVGSPGLDWIHRTKLKTKAEIQNVVPIEQPFIIACFHPVTKELEHTEQQLMSFYGALHEYGCNVILINSNIDPNSDIVKSFNIVNSNCHKNWLLVNNLDHLTYLSLLQYAEMMVGNSSSGIIEAASFNLPVVNIGTRQEGRIKPDYVIDVGYGTEDILQGIERAKGYKDTHKSTYNPYGDGQSSKRIVEVLKSI